MNGWRATVHFASMRGPGFKLALGLIATASGPLALFAWNQSPGRGSVATPVGGQKWFASRPGFFDAAGVRDPELSPLGTVFNWTDGQATFRFPRLERPRPAVVTVRIQGPGTGAKPAPEVAFSVDGIEAARLTLSGAPKRVFINVPPRRGRGAVVSMKVENSTGVMVESVRLSATSGSLPIPREALGALAFVAVAAYLAALMAGASPWMALAVAMVQAMAASWLSVTGGAFLGRYSEKLVFLSGIGLVLSLAARHLRDLRWRRAVIAVVGVSVLKLSILGHPQIIDADAAGQAANLGRVLAGNWFFTSATPPPAISFPYPPGLYVAALPFSKLPQREWVALLRGISVATETAAFATFSVAVAALSTEAVGAMTFLLLALSPEGLAILFVGNLSNLFSDALMLFGCSFLVTRRPVLASLSLLGGFLSHFGTLLLGAPLSLLLALARWPKGGSVIRRIAPVLAALAMSFLLYYRRFTGVATEAWDRMAGLKGAEAVGPMTAPLADRLARMSGGESWWMTALLLVAAVIGIATWPKDRQALSRILFTWFLVIAGLALLGLVTPVQVRSALSARPLVAALCASGVCALWARGGRARALAGLVVLVIGAGCWSIATSFFPVRPA